MDIQIPYEVIENVNQGEEFVFNGTVYKLAKKGKTAITAYKCFWKTLHLKWFAK